MSSGPQILLTGATGDVGGRLLAPALANEDRHPAPLLGDAFVA